MPSKLFWDRQSKVRIARAEHIGQITHKARRRTARELDRERGAIAFFHLATQQRAACYTAQTAGITQGSGAVFLFLSGDR